MTDHIRFDEDNNALILLDQRFLPAREDYFECRTTADVIYALKEMVVRGAPAIGVTAAYGCCLALAESAGDNWRDKLKRLLDDLAGARPTAVNLRWAVDRMTRAWADNSEAGHAALSALWLTTARRIHSEDIEINKTMGRYGAVVVADGDTVMTHCNAGALATAGYGTALGVIRAAVEQGKNVRVIANETRPFLQGARLTAYELHKDNIPVTVACDNACALLMASGGVNKVVVGADRIAANGDTANKIGTYGVALLAGVHKIPFYVAAPLSTIDLHTPSGREIPIEQRTPKEVTHIGDTQITPEGVPVYNFAFDITPAGLIAGIITEKGILESPYEESIARAFED